MSDKSEYAQIAFNAVCFDVAKTGDPTQSSIEKLLLVSDCAISPTDKTETRLETIGKDFKIFDGSTESNTMVRALQRRLPDGELRNKTVVINNGEYFVLNSRQKHVVDIFADQRFSNMVDLRGLKIS